MLGESRTATVGTRTLFLANGNNVVPVGDMTRRTIPIHLDAKEEFPASRVFRNPNLISQVKRNREHYASCALTIISAWIKAGKPIAQCKALNSFAQWAELCRQSLMWLDMEDPAANVFSTMAEDPERVNTGRVFNGLVLAFRGGPFTTKDISQRINSSVDSAGLREPLEDVGCFDGYSINRGRLGWWLKKKVGWTIDGIRLNLVAVDAHTKQPKYQLSISKHQE